MATLVEVGRRLDFFVVDVLERLGLLGLEGSSGQSKPQWLERHVRGPLARGLCDRPQSRGLFDASIGDRFGHRNLQAWLVGEMGTDEILRFSLAGRNDKDTKTKYLNDTKLELYYNCLLLEI